jgi:hypothetical protein
MHPNPHPSGAKPAGDLKPEPELPTLLGSNIAAHRTRNHLHLSNFTLQVHASITTYIWYNYVYIEFGEYRILTALLYVILKVAYQTDLFRDKNEWPHLNFQQQ